MSTELIVEQFGKIHLVVVHFPIVLLLLAPLVLFLSLRPGGLFWRKVIPYLVHLSAVATVGVTVLGLLLAVKRGALQGPLHLHRLLGIVTTVVIVAASAYLLARKPDLEKRIPAALWALLLLAAACVGLTGHEGGTSVHGDLIILGREADPDEL